jgi:hypothetical protein
LKVNEILAVAGFHRRTMMTESISSAANRTDKNGTDKDDLVQRAKAIEAKLGKSSIANTVSESLVT